MHPYRAALESLALGPEAERDQGWLADVAGTFEISTRALKRHLAAHLAEDEVRQIRAREALVSQRRLEIRALPRLAGLLDKVQGWGDALLSGDGSSTVLPDLLREAVKGFDLMGKMTGEGSVPEAKLPGGISLSAPNQIVMLTPNFFGSTQDEAVQKIRQEALEARAEATATARKSITAEAEDEKEIEILDAEVVD